MYGQQQMGGYQQMGYSIPINQTQFQMSIFRLPSQNQFQYQPQYQSQTQYYNPYRPYKLEIK